MKKFCSFFVFVLVFVFSSCTPNGQWGEIMDAYLHNDSVQQLLLVKYTEGSNAYLRALSKIEGTYKADKEGRDYSDIYASYS